jgi:hypothetical protein
VIIAGPDHLGLVAQLVERRLCEAEALGPNPSKSINRAHLEANSKWKGGGSERDATEPEKPCTSFATRRSLRNQWGIMLQNASQGMARLKR